MKNTRKKLTLNRETVRFLTADEKARARGGYDQCSGRADCLVEPQSDSDGPNICCCTGNDTCACDSYWMAQSCPCHC